MPETKLNIENMVLGTHIPAIRLLKFEEINNIIMKSKIGFWEILREDTSTPMLKLKSEINGRMICSLLWIRNNKIQFMGVKNKKDAIECYDLIIQELIKFTRGFLDGKQ